MPHPRFRITKGEGDEYTFNLTAANGEKILSSERYTSHSGAVRGVAAVKESAIVDARYERREARDGTVYFVLKAGNGEIVGTSEMYGGSTARERGMESVKVNALVAGGRGRGRAARRGSGLLVAAGLSRVSPAFAVIE